MKLQPSNRKKKEEAGSSTATTPRLHPMKQQPSTPTYKNFDFLSLSLSLSVVFPTVTLINLALANLMEDK